MTTPIIQSLLDTDFYKFTMGQFVFNNYPNTRVRYAFKCRTKNVNLLSHISLRDIQRELDATRDLTFRKDQLEYLTGLRGSKNNLNYFSKDYINFLSNLKLPPYRLDELEGNLVIEVCASWKEAIYWETFILSIVNELYNRRFQINYVMAGERLINKIDILKANKDIDFSDFGTRRRLSNIWQNRVVDSLNASLPNYLGTSNVDISMRHRSNPIGTFAHELMMVTTALALKKEHSLEALVKANQKVLEDWLDLYGTDLAIALSDTYGSKIFFKDIFDPDLASEYRGVRQDSGDPYHFAHEAIQFYQRTGIDPKTKTIVFSDGLELPKMIALQKHFGDKINVVFGWGTNLTNDTGLEPLSIVVKPIEADGQPCIKLSDNIAKATGPKIYVDQYKKFINYEGMTNEECKY